MLVLGGWVLVFIGLVGCVYGCFDLSLVWLILRGLGLVTGFLGFNWLYFRLVGFLD